MGFVHDLVFSAEVATNNRGLPPAAICFCAVSFGSEPPAVFRWGDEARTVDESAAIVNRQSAILL